MNTKLTFLLGIGVLILFSLVFVSAAGTTLRGNDLLFNGGSIGGLENLTLTGTLSIFDLNVLARSNFTENATFGQDVNILGTLYGGSPVKIGGGMNITTGHLFISAGNLHLDGDLIHDKGNVSFSGGDFIINTSDFFVNVNSGYIGIGTISPALKLEVNGSVGIVGTIKVDNIEPFTSNRINISESIIKGKLLVQGSESVGGYNATIEIENLATGGDRWFLRAGATGTITPAGGFSIADTAAYRFVIDEDGRVGIGTTSPDRMLHISRGSNVGIHLEDTSSGGNFSLIAWSATNTFSIYDETNSQHRLVILDSGYIGIGTQSPGLPLEVRSADDNQIFVFDSRSQAQGVGGGIAFGGKYNDAGGEALGGRIAIQKTNGISGNVSFDMIFETQDFEGSIQERMILTGDGFVGIGVEDPDSSLEVSGNIHIISLEGSYSNGEAYACVYNNGTLFAKDSACS